MNNIPGRHEAGATIVTRELTTITGQSVRVPDESKPIHLQFRRFAGCPVCNLHLRSIIRRREEIEAMGVRELVVFHADPGEVLRYEADLPLDVIADPTKRLYREFGVESSPRALTDPRAWRPIIRAAATWVRGFIAGQRRLFRLRPQGGRLGLPADFLIADDGRVIASKYGKHADDQWSVDELLTLAAAYRADPTRQAGTRDVLRRPITQL